MSGGKRSFPYFDKVQPMDLKSRKVEGAYSLEDAEEELPPPPWMQQGGGSHAEAAGGTDFASWSVGNIKTFLDERGEDYDDCIEKQDLVRRARDCEISTGPPKPQGAAAAQEEEEEEEEDPLDAFMKDIQKEASKAPDPKNKAKEPVGGLDEEADNVTDFVEARKRGEIKATFMAKGDGSDADVYATQKAMQAGVDVQYDDDDNPIISAADRKKIEPLAALEHGAIEYDDFCKEFYEPHPAVAAMSDADVNAARRQAQIRVAGFDPPRPVMEFAHMGLDKAMMGAIAKQGYTKPTPIQCQAIPAALSGRDVLGIAKTGSGKTAAFLIPMMVHIMDQPELNRGEGPIAVIAAPTRELAQQIHQEGRKFAKPYKVGVAGVFGGMNKQDQYKELKAGVEVVVCTPGRLIDWMKNKTITMRRTTFLVLDECDRMFDMGFEPQVRSIVGQIRPDRQTLLFSATMPNKIHRMASDALSNPVRVTVGVTGDANEDIKQLVEVLANEETKWPWLAPRLPRFVDEGDVLIFCGRKEKVEEVEKKIGESDFRVACLHGDKDQASRMDVLKKFKEGHFHVLVATDVAARGLDIKSIKTVINFDAARDMDTHVHRIGRTGRAGDKDGTAYTLLTEKEGRFAAELVGNLVAAGQEVPRSLHDLALTNKGFRGKGGGRGGRGGRGRGRGRGGRGATGLGFAPSGLDAQRGRDGSLVSSGPMGFARQQQQGMGGFTKASASGMPGDDLDVGAGVKKMFQGRFQSSFVSGSKIEAEDNKPSIIMPKRAPARPVAPPPERVTAPLVPVQAARPAPAMGAAAAAAAQAAAAAIAARISAQAMGGGGAPPGPPPGPPPGGKSSRWS